MPPVQSPGRDGGSPGERILVSKDLCIQRGFFFFFQEDKRLSDRQTSFSIIESTSLGRELFPRPVNWGEQLPFIRRDG